MAYIQATRLGLAPLAPLAFASQVRCPRIVGLASAMSRRGFCSLHVLVSCAHSHSSHARVAVAFIMVLPSSRRCRMPSLVRMRPPPSLVQVHSSYQYHCSSSGCLGRYRLQELSARLQDEKLMLICTEVGIM